jgi:putative phosphonate metabolism protein
MARWRQSNVVQTPMADFPRYAIYYPAPHGSALDRFGAQLLGYDAWTGEDVPFPDDMLQAVPNWRELTQDPRKYGFHATLKAPFSLDDGKSEAELLAACAEFARTPRPIPAIRPVVGSISGFIAAIPAEPSDELLRLAADCVDAFDAFRAPLTPQDRARRKPEMLTPRQRGHLDRWGYPYVMDEFRFHLTLTGRIDAAARAPILKMLQERFELIDPERLAIDRIALFRQDNARSRFHVLQHWTLGIA